MTPTLRALVSLFALVAIPVVASASVVLDFEDPLPGGLTATSYIQGTAVPTTSVVTDQYLSQGILMSGAALVAGGLGHTASGFNGLAGMNSGGFIDYDQAVTFSFFALGGGTAATTDFFAYSPDLGGGSGNTITISAYDLYGLLIGQVSFVENGTFTSPLSISGVGQFHSVVVDQTLYNVQSGGIMLDLVQFGDLLPANTVAEPGTGLLAILGMVGLIAVGRRLEHSKIRPDERWPEGEA